MHSKMLKQDCRWQLAPATFVKPLHGRSCMQHADAACQAALILGCKMIHARLGCWHLQPRSAPDWQRPMPGSMTYASQADAAI